MTAAAGSRRCATSPWSPAPSWSARLSTSPPPFPDDFPLSLPADVDVLGRGGACVVAPNGDIIAGPLHDEEGIVFAECDLARALHAKRYVDAAGHYGRADVLTPRPI